MPEKMSAVAIDVAQKCYEHMRKLREGSEEAEAAELAISMALSQERSPKDAQLLLNDVLRNGRHSVRRSRARLSAAVEECGYLAERGIASGATRGFVSLETPEDLFLIAELTEHLYAATARCGPHGPRILEGLFSGETTLEIARAAGVSTSTVNRTTRSVREAAKQYMSA